MKALKLVNISKDYNNKKIISNMNLSVKEGEMIAITGKSGTGKTTILNIIGLVSKKSEGDLYIFNQKNIDINSKEAMMLRREYIGYLFQNYALIEDETVKWNLMLPLKYKKLSKKDKEKMIIQTLKRLHLVNLLDNKVYTLSGGEQQRIAMARIMLQGSSLILADEPTGSLDDVNRNDIVELLKTLNEEGKTIIIVTHDNYVAQNCNRIVSLT